MNDVKLYQSIKHVHATPYTDHQYNAYVSRPLYLTESHAIIPTLPDSEREGYLVIYNKDKPNQYISWCPKAEFEEGNVEVDTTTLELKERGQIPGIQIVDDLPFTDVP